MLFEFLKTALRERRWTIPHFARECQVSAQLAYKWLAEDEAMRIVPSPASCEKIASALDLDADYILELAGHRKPREPRAEIDAKRQAVRERFERWAAAVGPEYEDLFWTNLTSQAESNIRLIDEIRTAVNAERDAAVSAAVSEHAMRRRKSRRDGGESLVVGKHTITHPLGYRAARTNALCAA
jgi:transcriptional regulator with XRE-family HTH domain